MHYERGSKCQVSASHDGDVEHGRQLECERSRSGISGEQHTDGLHSSGV